jgi:hypothetical protein
VRKWVVVAVLIVVSLGVAATGAVLLHDEAEERFCTAGLAIAPAPPELVPILSATGRILAFQDQGEPGDDGCEKGEGEFWGPSTDPYVRADDCVIVYPDDWSAERPVESIEPTNPDGTCWREPH